VWKEEVAGPMLYHLAVAFEPYFGPLNALTYLSVRAGGAALTGFLFCLIFGPTIIRLLRALKIGQFIKKDHVAGLHDLHKGKAGTPTMGGVMILLSTLFSLLLWSTLTNRLLWIALGVLLALGAVGFLDDFIKLRRKHNDGLSARAKFIGQILTGGFLGVYLWLSPITPSATLVQARDIVDWPGLAQELVLAGEATTPTPTQRIWQELGEPLQEHLVACVQPAATTTIDRMALLFGLNSALRNPDLYVPGLWNEAKMDHEARELLAGPQSPAEHLRLNRLLLEAALPRIVAHSGLDLHTSVGIPGFKDVFIPLGPLYVLFVIFIIVSLSNAVNLTDGLDGLAAGASVASILTFAAIAYVVSRADWSQYLFVTYVPEASELFVFGGALLGTGLGFLWFNAHPAEVFMGDTGSLALGGAIAVMGILTKQELLLPIVAGLFVMEAGSVVLQVASFKLTGKRIFRMSPLHHHFELLGWPETKVVMRFWILALLFALMSLATLKLR
jgi:UDP-N-acetylmuramyl pentapeptide phosphotransferase/UDP-N-acetylglucosamine-1-phosphate transferase